MEQSNYTKECLKICYDKYIVEQESTGFFKCLYEEIIHKKENNFIVSNSQFHEAFKNERKFDIDIQK